MNSVVTIVLSKSCKSFSFDEIWNSSHIEGPDFNGSKNFSDSWRLSILKPVDIGTCDPFCHSFGPKMANLPILIKFCTLHKRSVVNSMVTIVFWDSWCLPMLAIVSIGTCYLLGHSFWSEMANAPVLIKFCTLHKTRVVNLMVSILRGASGCRRKLDLGI